MTVILAKVHPMIRCGSCGESHASIAGVYRCSDLDMEAYGEYRGETYGETGHVPESYASVIHRWLMSDAPETHATPDPEDEVCEHGLSAWLCTGPNHYPVNA